MASAGGTGFEGGFGHLLAFFEVGGAVLAKVFVGGHNSSLLRWYGKAGNGAGDRGHRSLDWESDWEADEEKAVAAGGAV